MITPEHATPHQERRSLHSTRGSQTDHNQPVICAPRLDTQTSHLARAINLSHLTPTPLLRLTTPLHTRDSTQILALIRALPLTYLSSLTRHPVTTLSPKGKRI